MTCRISTGRINTIIGKSRLVSTVLENIIKGGRLDPPHDVEGDFTNFINSLGAAVVQCRGYAVPAGPSFVSFFMKTFGGDIPIPDQTKYLDWDIDFSDEDFGGLQNLQSAISDLEDLVIALDCSTSDDFGLCISTEALDDYRQRVIQSLSLLRESRASGLFDDFYGMAEPCFGGIAKSAMIIPYSVASQIQVEKQVIETVIATMTQGKRITSYTYECDADPDVPPPPDDDDPPDPPVDDEKCDRLIDAIENFQLDLSPIIEKIDAIEIPPCPEIPTPEPFEYNRVINPLTEEIRRINIPDSVPVDYDRIINPLTEEIRRINIPDSVPVDYDRIINGVLDRLTVYLDPKFPQIAGFIPYNRSCGLGNDGAQNYLGIGFSGIESAIQALGRQVNAIQQNLCSYTNIKGNNVRDSLNNRIDGINIPACPGFDYDRVVNPLTNEIRAIDIPECPQPPEPTVVDYERIVDPLTNEIRAIDIPACPEPPEPTVVDYERITGPILEAIGEIEIPDEPDSPMIIYPTRRHDNIIIESQIEIRWIPENDDYRSGVSAWTTHIPNPRTDLNWCRDFDPLRWRKGEAVRIQLEWGKQDKGMTHASFADEASGEQLMQALAALSQSPNPVMRKTFGGKLQQTIQERTVKVGRVNVAFFDANGDVVRALCLKPPKEGC